MQCTVAQTTLHGLLLPVLYAWGSCRSPYLEEAMAFLPAHCGLLLRQCWNAAMHRSCCTCLAPSCGSGMRTQLRVHLLRRNFRLLFRVGQVAL